MKHKHAEVIKAWADGAQIQAYRGPERGWVDQINPIVWSDDVEYRVKPAEPARVYPVTTMSDREISECWGLLAGERAAALHGFANGVLIHACDKGQVVTRGEFDRMCGDRHARDMAVARAVVCDVKCFEPVTYERLAAIIAKVKP